jgi:hypothetical protein
MLRAQSSGFCCATLMRGYDGDVMMTLAPTSPPTVHPECQSVHTYRPDGTLTYHPVVLQAQLPDVAHHKGAGRDGLAGAHPPPSPVVGLEHLDLEGNTLEGLQAFMMMSS